MNSKLEEFIFDSRKANSANELFLMYEGIVESFGYDRFAYAVTSDHPDLKSCKKSGIVEKPCLNGWNNYYIDNNYLAIDATHKMGLANPGVFVWKDIVKTAQLSKPQLTIFEEAEEANLHHGSTISMHGPGGVKAVALLSSSQRSRTFEPQTLDKINLISYHFHLCFLSLMKHKPPTVTLTSKEEEVMKWAAKGLTKPEISTRLNTSPHTVDYHIRNVLKKLGARNTSAALVTAVKQGIVTI